MTRPTPIGATAPDQQPGCPPAMPCESARVTGRPSQAHYAPNSAALVKAGAASFPGTGDDISIVLPLPPTTNKLWAPVRTKKGAKLVTRGVYAAWKAQAKREVEMQREGARIDGAFRAAIIIPEGAYDSDNLIKPALDACQAGGAIANDKHCRGGSWDVDDTRVGTVQVVLSPIPPIARAPRRKRATAREESIS